MMGTNGSRFKYVRAGAVGALLLVSLSALATAATRADGDLGGKGGEVPTPFADLNTKVELADGGDYLLVGRVVYPAQTPYFHVDLALHPWLENKRRSSDPLYPLIEDGFSWKAYDGDWLTVAVRAEGRIVSDKDGKPLFDIYLRPLSQPSAYQPDDNPPPTEPSVPGGCEIPSAGVR